MTCKLFRHLTKMFGDWSISSLEDGIPTGRASRRWVEWSYERHAHEWGERRAEFQIRASREGVDSHGLDGTKQPRRNNGSGGWWGNLLRSWCHNLDSLSIQDSSWSQICFVSFRVSSLSTCAANLEMQWERSSTDWAAAASLILMSHFTEHFNDVNRTYTNLT